MKIKWPKRLKCRGLKPYYKCCDSWDCSACEINRMLDACKQAVKDAGVGEVRFPSYQLHSNLCADSGGYACTCGVTLYNAAIDEFRRLNEEKK